MQNLIFPNLYCPFLLQTNKYVDVIEDYGAKWLQRFNLLNNESEYQRFCQSKFFLLAASAYTKCELEELKIANDVISWLFIWDDQCDVSDLGKEPEALKVICNRFIEILNGAELTTKDIPLGYALSDIRQRIIKRGGITFFHHFVCYVEDYFHGCVEEANNRVQLVVPVVDTYIKIRRSSTAAALCLVLIEFCDRLTIPYFLRNHEFLQKLTQTTINILAWSNDIFSAPREIADGEVHNLVLVLHYQQKLPLEQAIRTAAKMHDQEVERLINLEASMPSFGVQVDAEITKYLSGMHNWISGNLAWYSRSGRYHIAEERIELVAS